MIPAEITAMIEKGKHEVAMPSHVITTAGLNALKEWLYTLPVVLAAPDGGYHVRTSLAAEGSDWLTRQSTYPKRLGKALRKDGIKLSQPDLSQLGSIASEHCSRRDKWIVDVVEKFDWKAGDFGDEGSCFWGCRPRAKDMMLKNGFLAFRMYDADGKKGYARAWIGHDSDSDDPCAVLFNIYSRDHALTLLGTARLLAQATGLSYKKVRISNNGREDGELWLNNNYAQLIGSLPILEKYEEFDFKIDEPDPEEEYTCENCGRTHGSEDDLVPGGCCDCRSFCTNCDEWRDADDMHHNRGGYRYGCTECLTQCDTCGAWFYNDDINGEGLCDDCNNAKYTEKVAVAESKTA